MIKIGLALGGGGARGAIHIGVLAALREMGIVPDLITGTSIGALVGALAAYGLKTEEMLELFDQFGFRSLYSLPGSKPALTSLNKFDSLLQKHIGRPTFDKLKTPLAVVATNLVTHQEVVLDQGDVTSAVQASMAFPILLPPVEYDGMVLVDGGLVNNVPFDVARARGCTFVIAVSLGNSAPYGTVPEAMQSSNSLFERALLATKRRPLVQVVTAVTDIITNRVVQSRLAISRPDVLLEPRVGTIGLLDFHTLKHGFNLGYSAVQEITDELTGLLELLEKRQKK